MARTKEKWFKKKRGVQVGHVKLLTNLRFADDVLLMGRSFFQVREMLEDLIREAKVLRPPWAYKRCFKGVPHYRRVLFVGISWGCCGDFVGMFRP